MFGTQILDVAIGLVFIFLMLSLVVTALNELGAAWFKRRSATMWRGVVRLLGDEGFANSLYAHPLISSLSETSGGKPSYIPSRTFVLAMLDALTDRGAPPPGTPEEVVAVLAKMPPGREGLATALTVMLHDAGGNMEEFKKALEQWFDNSMERVSGWYKRRTQWILLGMAFGVTIWANADAIGLANTLWRDPAMRSALVAQAQQYTDQQRKESDTATVAQPLAQPKGGPTPPPAESPSEAPEYEAASAKFDRSLEGIRSMAIPLGWGDATNKEDKREPIPALTNLWPTISRHGLGWLLTTLAISLGAPFWFDMLNKVVSIRAAGKAPEEKQKLPKQVPTPVEPGGKPAVG